MNFLWKLYYFKENYVGAINNRDDRFFLQYSPLVHAKRDTFKLNIYQYVYYW